MIQSGVALAFSSIPGVADTHLFGTGTPDLLIEIPHGATDTTDFTSLQAQLTSTLPEGLVDFFHVNTDVGAPELALAIAENLEGMGRTVAIVRCRVPRTFIDCNRRMDASPSDFKAGRVTPGLMPWITTDEDRALLRSLYDQYSAVVAAVGADTILMLHSYAPRDVDVEVDGNIVAKLRHAYQPEVEPTWPLRPELDIISRALDGTNYAPADVATALRENLAAIGSTVADGATYPLHPSTMAWDHVMARPGRALCVEVRRDLLADPFTPFAQMTIGAAKVARLARPFASALRRWWS